MAKQQPGGKIVNPLQAQLLKAGLVKPEQLRRAEQQRRDAAKRGEKRPAVDRATQQAQQKADADRERNRRRLKFGSWGRRTGSTGAARSRRISFWTVTRFASCHCMSLSASRY